jgi:hypothetical protein
MLSLRSGEAPRPGRAITMTTTTEAILSQDAIRAKFETLNAVAEQLRSKAGSAAKRRNDAKLAVLEATVTIDSGDIPEGVLTYARFLASAQDAAQVDLSIGGLAQAAEDLCAWAHHVGTEAVNAYLSAQGTPEDLTALKEKFDQLKSECESVLKVAEAGLIPKEMVEGLTIPQLRAPRGTGGSKPSGSKFGHFYRILPSGEKRYKLSSMAWYFGALMCGKPGEGSSNDGKGVPVPELESYLRKHVTDSPIGKPWEYEVQTDAGNVRFGFEVTTNTPSSNEEE